MFLLEERRRKRLGFGLWLWMFLCSFSVVCFVFYCYLEIPKLMSWREQIMAEMFQNLPLFFFCTLLTVISNSGALSSATTVTVCVTCRFLFAMLFPYCILSLTPLSHSFYLVYVIILVFCLASAMSLYNCLAALIGEIPFGQCRYCMPLDFYKVSFGYLLVSTPGSVKMWMRFDKVCSCKNSWVLVKQRDRKGGVRMRMLCKPKALQQHRHVFCLLWAFLSLDYFSFRIACGNRNIEVRLIFLAAFCIAAAAVWAVFRNEDR